MDRSSLTKNYETLQQAQGNRRNENIGNSARFISSPDCVRRVVITFPTRTRAISQKPLPPIICARRNSGGSQVHGQRMDHVVLEA